MVYQRGSCNHRERAWQSLLSYRLYLRAVEGSDRSSSLPSGFLSIVAFVSARAKAVFRIANGCFFIATARYVSF